MATIKKFLKQTPLIFFYFEISLLSYVCHFEPYVLRYLCFVMWKQRELRLETGDKKLETEESKSWKRRREKLETKESKSSAEITRSPK